MFGDLFLEMLAFCGCVLLAGFIIATLLTLTAVVILLVKGVVAAFKYKDETDSRK